MANTKPITELDFDQIKTDIINFIKTDPTFTDYSFEGSALNAIIDVLAYNTHTNAYYANMLHNEGFIDTAQKRSSVVSRAKELGYTPRSASCSVAYVNVTVIGGATDPNPLTLNRGDIFTTSNENGPYTFIVSDDITSVTVGSDQIFTQVKLLNGSTVENFFTIDTLANPRTILSIPNKNIDTSTLRVFVRDSISSLERVEYTSNKNLFKLTATSTSFFIQESYDGFFQIYFGDDIVGKQPVDGNIIELYYIVTDNYKESDNCRLFNYEDNIGGFTNLNIVTTQASFGGSFKETIDSIKDNAVKANSSKGRSITVADYESELTQKYPFIKSVSVWGGEDNVPPIYGKVFVSIQPVAGYTLTDSMKTGVIVPEIRRSSMVTIVPELIDPNYVSLEFTTKIKFNPNKSTSSQYAIEGIVKTAINEYVESISNFNTDYLQSSLTNKILAVNPGIISVDISKYVGFKISPVIGVETSFDKHINNPIVAGSIKSTKFKVFYGGEIVAVTVKEIPGRVTQTTNINGFVNTVQSLGLYSDNNKLIKDIGNVNLSTGQYNITFAVYAHISSISSSRFIQISSKLVNTDIATLRNQILIMEIGGEDPSIGFLNNNKVLVEIYDK